MTPEEQAVELSKDKYRLMKRLQECRALLSDKWKRMFRPGKFDFKNKRLVSDDGAVAIQWSVRSFPHLPESYNNQQTSGGVCHVVAVDKKLIKVSDALPNPKRRKMSSPKIGTVQHITKQQAVNMLSAFGWVMVKRGYEWISKDNKWMVYSVGDFCKRRRVKPSW